jgi:signal transduction histidine kinase
VAHRIPVVSKSVVTLLTVGVLAAFSVFRVVDLGWWRTQTLTAADARAANLSFILSEYLREMFAEGDASLRQVTQYSHRIGGPTAPAEQWGPVLGSAIAGVAGIGSITITDSAGIITHSTLPLLVGQSRADQFILKQLASQASDDLVIGEPYLSMREPRTYLIPMGRRLSDNQNRFTGTVTATVVPSSQRPFLSTVDVGRRGIVWVFHPNGFVLFREPSAVSATGARSTDNPVFDEAKRTGGSGTIRAAIQPGGAIMLSGYRTTTTPPLIVAVSLDRDEVLTDWRHQVRDSAVLFGSLAVLVAGMLGILFRQIDAKAAAERALAEARDHEATHLQELNTRLTAALDAEQRTNTLKDEFLMTVSHELRTPLTAIYGWARMLAGGGLDERRRQTGIETIERNARAQMTLVNDLLDVASIVRGKLRLELRAIDLATLLDETRETLRPAADAKAIGVETVHDPSVGMIIADPDRLQQIAWNLLSNAVKFTPRGGHVTISTRRIADEIDIVVADTGAGIAPEFLPHVFDRFRQAEGGSTRRHGGLGLGLAIVRHLVETHGGSVEVASDGEGSGATFRVRLPAKPVH